MNFACDARSNDSMTAALRGEIGLDDLEIELLAMIAELDPRDDAPTEAHVGGALLALAEMDRGDRDETSVRRTLRDLVGEPEPAGIARTARS
jgi:hypothetical protein